MNKIKYFFQFIIISLFFLIFKIIGIRASSFLGGKIIEIIGPLFRSKQIVYSNIKKAFPNINESEKKKDLSTDVE